MTGTAMQPAPISIGSALLALVASSPAERLEDFSYQAGSDLGRAVYCGEASARSFAALATAHIRQTAPNAREWGSAMLLFADAARVRATYGPISESCTEFLEGYRTALQALQRQLRAEAPH